MKNVMDVSKNSIIFERCSIRNFSEKEILRSQIEDIITAGMQAPSARNERPWEFLVITSEEGKEKIASIGPQASCCENAPAIILALANLSRIPNGSPWWIQDMSACIENMLLRTVEIGMGGVWLGIYPRESRVEIIREKFFLKDNIVPVAAVPIGYPLEKRTRKNVVQTERISWEEQA